MFAFSTSLSHWFWDWEEKKCTSSARKQEVFNASTQCPSNISASNNTAKLTRKTSPLVHHISNGKCSKALRQPDFSPTSVRLSLARSRYTWMHLHPGGHVVALALAMMPLLRWKTFNGSVKVVCHDVTERPTCRGSQMLKCFIVILSCKTDLCQ